MSIMATREDLIKHLWTNIINPHLEPATLDNIVQNCRRFPSASFSEAGPAIERVLAAGVSPKDLCLITHMVAYESVFGTLYAIGDPGVDGDDVFGLYEELGGADAAG